MVKERFVVIFYWQRVNEFHSNRCGYGIGRKKMIAIVKTVTHFFVLVPLLLFPITGRAQESGGQGDIALGMSKALSGPAEDLGKNMKQGVLRGLERVNETTGGINDRKLKLIALDDGYEPTRTAPNMRRLIQKEKVMAIIGNVVPPTAIAAIPIANEQKTLLFAAYRCQGIEGNPSRPVCDQLSGYLCRRNGCDD